MARLLAVVAVAAGLFAAPAQAADLKQILTAAAEGKAAPGAGILVIKAGKVADKAVVGVRRKGEAAAISPDDVWNIGSDGKAMTAVMIARLVERGVLAWDAPLERLWPDLPASVRPEYRAATLKQLMTHTSGLPENLRDMKAVNTLFYDEVTGSDAERRRAYVLRALQDEPVGKPGRYGYSNTGFLLAAILAERATGSTYEALMRKEVFEPLGMKSAGFGLTPAGQPIGHISGRVAIPRDINPAFFSPAGNIYLSLDDWARFCVDQLQGANGRGALLKPETYALMQTPQAGAPVSMGWFPRANLGGMEGPVLYHEGSDGAWYAIAALFPKTGAGVLVVSNGGKTMGGNALDTAAGLAAIKALSEPAK